MLKGFYLTLMIGPVIPVIAPKPVVDALTSVQITSASGQRSGFQLTFSMNKNSSITKTLLPAGYFDPLIRVVVVVTVMGMPTVLIDGVITRQEINPSNEPGQSTLTVTGEDLTAVMDLIDFTGIPYPSMPAEARVAMIVAKYAMFGLLPLVIPSVFIDVPIPVAQTPSHQGTDLAYIKSLAADVGYVFYIDPGPAPGANIAYWGPEIKVGAPQPALNVNMDAHTNVESLSFSFDGMAKKLFIVNIQDAATKAPIPIPIPDVTPFNPPLGLKPPIPLHLEFLNGTAKLSPLQAIALGLGKASQSSDVITGSGQLDVLRYGRPLKARQLVGVRGAGIAYDGLYYVRSVTHNIKRGEYKQSFSLSRNGLISTTPAVPV